MFTGFRYRFYGADDLVSLLIGIREMILRYGSLERLFATHASRTQGPYVDALEAFVSELSSYAPATPRMVSLPSKGSGCKRLFLYLRWMIRRDAVDPGPWRTLDPSRLLVPVDVHVLNLCRRMGITHRNSADLRTTREITDYFRRIRPDDPVRYDFSIARLGIRPDLDYAVVSDEAIDRYRLRRRAFDRVPP